MQINILESISIGTYLTYEQVCVDIHFQIRLERAEIEFI